MSENNRDYGVSQFQRNNYFYGKLMSVRDFKLEQEYMNDKRHLLNRMINGFGIVCGLDDADVSDEGGNIRIKFKSGGMVIDRLGREIVIPVQFEKDVIVEGTSDTQLIADKTYYLYLEYIERKSELVGVVSDASSGSQESCSYNREIEDFQVVASTIEPNIPTISSPLPFVADIPVETVKQQVREWLQKETSNYCSEPEEERVFILALKKSNGQVEIDPEKTADHLSFVANNRVLSELMACHLADFTNPHKSLVGLKVEEKEVYNDKGYITIEKSGAISLTPEKDNHKITIGETHSGKTDNPHEVKMSQLKDFNASDNKIANLKDPTKNKDAANKSYIDKKDSEVRGYADEKDAEVRGYVDEQDSQLKEYVDEKTTAANIGALETVNGVERDENGNVELVAEEETSIIIKPNAEAKTITISETHSKENGNPHHTKHSQIKEVLEIFGDEDADTRNKHVSNNDAAKWNRAAEEPIGLKSVNNVENPGGNINLVAGNAIEIAPNNFQNLITISDTHSKQKGNLHHTKHREIEEVLAVFEDYDADAKNKHISNNDAQKWNSAIFKINEIKPDEGGNITIVEGSGVSITTEEKKIIISSTGISKGTVSSSSNIENVTTEHTRQLNVSDNSTAGGDRSQVNASGGSAAIGDRSQVNACWNSTTGEQNSQVNASWGSAASHRYSQVNASKGVENVDKYTVCGGFGGTEGGPSPNNRKWELNSQNGDFTYLGTLKTTLSDYGEYFENVKKSEIDMGVLIALEEEKVRPAKADEDFIGVVSGTAAIRLGDSPFCWQGRYLKDEWGRPVYEEIKDPSWQPKTMPDEKWRPRKGQSEADRPMKAVETEKDRPTIRVQKENPDYDPKRKPKPRSERPKEWTLVGLLGQVYVRCDDTVKPGGFVKSSNNGIGTMSGEKTKLRAMKVTKAFDGKYSIVYCLLK
jgi:hypothetical protein